MGEFRAGLHHVQLAIPAGGEDAARRFYGDLVGMTEIAKAHPGVLLESLGDLETLAGELTGAGIEVTWDDGLLGYRRFHTHDPHGNRLEFMTVA